MLSQLLGVENIAVIAVVIKTIPIPAINSQSTPEVFCILNLSFNNLISIPDLYQMKIEMASNSNQNIYSEVRFSILNMPNISVLKLTETAATKIDLINAIAILSSFKKNKNKTRTLRIGSIKHFI